MTGVKGTRFFSTILSTTVIVVNAVSINAKVITPQELEKSMWLVCSSGEKVSQIKCDDTNSYALVTDLDLIKKLKKEYEEKEISELTSQTINIADDEINKYVDFLKSSRSLEYEEPKLRLGLLDAMQEYELKKELKDILKVVEDKPNLSNDELYNHPQLKLKEIDKKKFDDLLNSFRRNNYGNPQAGGAYIVCGAVGVIIVSKGTDIIVEKVTDSRTIDQFNERDLRKKIDHNLKPYIESKKSQKGDC